MSGTSIKETGKIQGLTNQAQNVLSLLWIVRVVVFGCLGEEV